MESSQPYEPTMVVPAEVLAVLEGLPPPLKTRARLSIEEVLACARRIRPGSLNWVSVWGARTVAITLGVHRLVFAPARGGQRVEVGIRKRHRAPEPMTGDLPLWRCRLGARQ